MDFYHPLNQRRIRKVFRAATTAETKLMVSIYKKHLLTRGGALPKALTPSPLLSSAIADYYHVCSAFKRPRSQELDKRALEEFQKVVGSLRVEEIEDTDLGSYIRHCQETKCWAASSINRNLNTIRHFLNWCFKKDWLPRNITIGLGRVPGPCREARPLKEAESTLIYENASRDLKLQILLALTLGLRRGEVAALEWTVINFETGRIQIGGTSDFMTKSGRIKNLFLTVKLRKALLERQKSQKGSSRWLFPNKAGSGPIDSHVITRAWCRARTKAKLRDVVFHDLRATAATSFAELGHGDATIARILGHSTERMARKYSHQVQDRILQNAIEGAERERELLSGNGGGKPSSFGQNTVPFLKLVHKDEA